MFLCLSASGLNCNKTDLSVTCVHVYKEGQVAKCLLCSCLHKKGELSTDSKVNINKEKDADQDLEKNRMPKKVDCFELIKISRPDELYPRTLVLTVLASRTR